MRLVSRRMPRKVSCVEGPSAFSAASNVCTCLCKDVQVTLTDGCTGRTN